MSLWDYTTRAGVDRWVTNAQGVVVHAGNGMPWQAQDFYGDEKAHFYYEWDCDRAHWPVYVYIKDLREGHSLWWSNKRVRIILDVYRSVSTNILEFIGERANIVTAECGLVQSRRRVAGVRRYPIDVTTPIVDLHRPSSTRRCYQYTADGTDSSVFFDSLFVAIANY